MQDQGPCFPCIYRPLRLSRILSPETDKNLDETVPLRRALFWVLVWLGILIGVILYFKYARLLTPLIG